MSHYFAYPDGPAAPPPEDATFWATRSQRDWRKLLADVQTLRFRPNETAIQAGDHSNGFYLVGFGRFQAEQLTINEGQAYGVDTFFTGRAHQAPLIAQTDGELLHMTKDAFATFAAREPELARAVLMELGRIVSMS